MMCKMNDDMIIHECVRCYTHKNMTHLRIELAKVSDVKLIRGFLTDIFSKCETYQIDQEDVLNIITEYNSEYQDKSNDELIDLMKNDNEYFRQKMIKISENNIKSYEDVLILINYIKEGNIISMKKHIENCDNIASLKHSKNVFIESELFEYLDLLDQRINQLEL